MHPGTENAARWGPEAASRAGDRGKPNESRSNTGPTPKPYGTDGALLDAARVFTRPHTTPDALIAYLQRENGKRPQDEQISPRRLDLVADKVIAERDELRRRKERRPLTSSTGVTYGTTNSTPRTSAGTSMNMFPGWKARENTAKKPKNRQNGNLQIYGAPQHDTNV